MPQKLKITPLNEWLPEAADFMIVGGPCSAESHDQLLTTAKALAADGKVHVLRAGIWKPRTRPNTFEGVGAEGLLWLREAGEITGLKTTTEVATPEHAEAALKAGIDILWIGARTTANPFSVQEIANVLEGTDIPVMIKNPINPELNLWLGALERVNRAGITKLIAIHRGFSTYHKQFRNAPHWEIPIQLKTLIPNLPVICDPSHISGSREHLQEVSQKAIDLDMNGLMVESHIHPEVALSDAQQQLTPSAFHIMLQALRLKSAQISSSSFQANLEELRSHIDRIDAELIESIAHRMEIAHKIGVYKQETNVTVLQIERWREILETRIPFGVNHGLDQGFMQKLLQLIHDESIRIQTEIQLKEKNKKKD